jgi:ComF family protein
MAEDLLPSGFFEGMDCLVPVPLHWKRERERGFNQAAVLAQNVSAVTGIPVIERALCRRVATEQQALRSREERSKNVRDAFSIEDRHVFEGKHVLLIDDVLTTGSTLEACARALSSCENVRVSVLALASTE